MQYLATKGGDKTLLQQGDIATVRNFEDGSLVSLHRGSSQIFFEAIGGPYGEREYFFPCDATKAQEIVSAIQRRRNYREMINPGQKDLAVQVACFHAIAIGVG